MNERLPPLFDTGEVHLWRVRLDDPTLQPKEMAEFLDCAERRRAARFRHSCGHRRFVVAHGALRRLLGAYCGCAPQALRFAENAWGKPSLRQPETDLRFNLSHSGEMAVCGITMGAPIGVDIEHRRAELAAAAITARFFASEEVAALRAIPEDQRVEAFFRCWTRKEAFIKARGEGLSLALDRFVVSLAPDTPARLLSIDGNAAAAAEWTLTEFSVPRGYTAALVVKGPIRQLQVWDWNKDWPFVAAAEPKS